MGEGSQGARGEDPPPWLPASGPVRRCLSFAFFPQPVTDTALASWVGSGMNLKATTSSLSRSSGRAGRRTTTTRRTFCPSAAAELRGVFSFPDLDDDVGVLCHVSPSFVNRELLDNIEESARSESYRQRPGSRSVSGSLPARLSEPRPPCV